MVERRPAQAHMARTRWPGIGIAAVCVLSALVGTRASIAAPERKDGGAEEDPKWAGLRGELQSGNAERIIAALETLEREKDRSRAARLINDLLVSGATLPIIERALSAATTLAQASSSTSVALYARHRSVEVRRLAVACLGKTGGDVAIAALRRGLRDSDSRVRGNAATGLGDLGAREAVPELFAALARQVPESARAIGMLCLDDDCRRFTGDLGKYPFDVMTSGLGAILLRADLSEDLKLGTIQAVGQLQTGQSTAFLQDILKRWPKGGSAKVRQALVSAIRAAGGDPGVAP